jgi:hypothetical protein
LVVSRLHIVVHKTARRSGCGRAKAQTTIQGVVHYTPIFRLQADVERRTALLRQLEERLAAVVEDAAVAAPTRKARYQHQVKLWTVDIERARKR